MITLVVPCYNEERRLNFSAFLEAGQEGFSFLFVDDGSSDQTYGKLSKYFSECPHVQILKLSKNCGKGEAIRQGILFLAQNLKSQGTDHHQEWWGFWDADLATPLAEVKNMLKYQAIFYPNAKGIFGSRVYRLGSLIKRSALRHYLGRGFATIIAHALQIEAYDTQCGAKLFRPDIAVEAFREPFVSPWIFDVELLLRLGQHDVIEYPLQNWKDVSGSKLSLLKEFFRIFIQILKIRSRYLTKKIDSNPL